MGTESRVSPRLRVLQGLRPPVEDGYAPRQPGAPLGPRPADGGPPLGRGAPPLSHKVLPPDLDAALDDPLSLLALEDWRRTHHEQPGKHADFESRLLSCEARLRKLDRLASRLRPPNVVVTAVVCDLIRRIFETLPQGLQQVCQELLKHVESAVYSGEKASDQDHAELRQALGSALDRAPYFAVVRQQLGVLGRMEKGADAMQEVVHSHLERRRSVLDFIGRLQQQERHVLMNWLFRFWATTYQQRQLRIRKVANTVLIAPPDILTPFTSWRIFVGLQKIERARLECDAMDLEASQVAGRIAEMEIENEAQQQRLQESLDVSQALKDKCQTEQRERARLQGIWDATQPELLLAVLAQSLEFLFRLVIRQANLSRLALQERSAGKDVSVLLEEDEAADEVHAEDLIVRWVNRCLSTARKFAERQLASKTSNLPAAERALLEMVVRQQGVEDLAEDLSDCGALCALYAVLKAERDERPFSAQDLWLLEERDRDLRASQLCTLFGPFAPTQLARSLLEPQDIVAGCSRRTGVFLASVMLEQPVLPEVMAAASIDDKAEAREKMQAVLLTLQDFAGAAWSSPIEDPTPLLHGGEDFQALATTSTELLLLRWINVQLAGKYSRPVENFGSDLQDGEALGLLLQTVAPEVSPRPLSSDAEEKLQQVVTAAARCTDFELLTVNAIAEGQADMLAAFLAQLFLCRPRLGTKPDSLLAMHLKLLERLCTDGLRKLSNLDQEDQNAEVMALCLGLDAEWSEFTLAAQTVQEATRTMAGMNDRVRAFLGDTLVHRAQGRPKTMLDAKEAREFLFYTSLNVEHFGPQANDGLMLGKTEDVLRKHFRFLREIFRHYGSQAGGGALSVSLEGFMKLYQDCKLRSRDLAPHHVEMLFSDQLDRIETGERTLSPQSFVAVLVQATQLKFRDKVRGQDLPEMLTQMIELHLKPHACQDKDSIFQRMAYNQDVRQVMEHHQKELAMIFDLYARLDQSSEEAMARAFTMNILEFMMLLKHCELLDETLSESEVKQIFDGIQKSATIGVDLMEELAEGEDDDDELALSEFLDGLIAIAAYKFPDPFTPFHSRVNAFVLSLFGAVRRYWSRKRISPQVDALLNALQKKLR